jgi:hypothetical protein
MSTEQQQITVVNPFFPGIKAGDLYDSTAIQNLNGMPYADYAQYFKGRIAHARDYRRRDTRIIAATETVAAKIHSFYTIPANGKGDTTLGGTITIDPKHKGLTNMVDAGRMEHNAWLIVESVQCSVVVSSRDYNSVSNGQPLNLAAAAEATNSATNTVLGLNRASYMNFKVGARVKAEGRMSEFPSDEVFSGAFGAVADEGFIQIGRGEPKPLKEIVVLEPHQNFTLELEFFVAPVFGQNVEIEWALVGVLLEDLQ